VSPPTREEQDQALAALSGTLAPPPAGDHLQASLLRLRAIADAKDAGRSWQVIGVALGMSGKQAKRHVKQLAAGTQRELIASRKA
jgi:hypothetical protein